MDLKSSTEIVESCPKCHSQDIDFLKRQVVEKLDKYVDKEMQPGIYQRKINSPKIKREWSEMEHTDQGRTIKRKVIAIKRVRVYNAYCPNCNAVITVGNPGEVALDYFKERDFEKEIKPQLIQGQEEKEEEKPPF